MKTLREDLRSLDARAAVILVFSAAMLVVVQFVGKSEYWTRDQRVRDWASNWLELQFAGQVAWAAVTVVCFGVLPFLFATLVLRMRPSEFGFSARGFLRHVRVYAALYLVMLPVVLWASKRSDFLKTYPFAALARTDDTWFYRWEIAYFLQFCALEMFFRGFIVFGLERRFGLNAIFVMTVPYTMLHFSKPMPEAFAAIAAGIVMGYLALKTRSFYGGVLLHYGVALTMDMLARSQA